MDYAQLYISCLSKVVVLKLPGGIDFALITILDTRGYWKEEL